MNSFKNHLGEDLRKWFKEKWVRMDTKGNIKGDCAREEGEGKPKCLPSTKAHSMSKEDRAKAARRKRRQDPVADRPGKGGKPINVKTMEEQMNLYEGNKPTNPALWSRAKALARSKFDVYPSAYANGWAAKWYKSKGGGWKSVSEGVDDEGGMAKGELSSIAVKAKELAKMMKKNKQLDAWVQSKITKADDYVGSVHDFLKNGKQEVDETRMEKVSFKSFLEEACCDECDDSNYGSVEEDFEPTGNEEYEDWDLFEAKVDPNDNSIPFEGPYTKAPKMQPGSKKPVGASRAKHLAQQMKDKMSKMKEDLDEAKDTDKYTYIDQSKGQVIKGKSGTYVGYTHSATKGKGANILKHNQTKKYYAAGGSSTAFTAKTTLHDTPEDAARAYHKGNLAEASPMIKPPKNEFAKKEDAFAHAKQHGGKVMKKTFTHPTSGMKNVSYVVREDAELDEAIKKPNATTRHLRDYPVSDKDVAKPVKKPEKKKDDGRKQQFRGTGGLPPTDDDGNVLEQVVAEGKEELHAQLQSINQKLKLMRGGPVGEPNSVAFVEKRKALLKQKEQILSQLKQGVSEGWGFDQWGHDTWTDAQKEVARKKKNEKQRAQRQQNKDQQNKDQQKSREQGVAEASSLAQQAAIAIAMKKAGKKPKDVSEETLEEAEKNGKRVQLNKPFRTSDGKGKFAVYAKNEKGNVVKVNFGDTTGLTIKTSNPDRRRNFRARHNCDNPGPKHKARYWACKSWSKDTVSAGLGTK